MGTRKASCRATASRSETQLRPEKLENIPSNCVSGCHSASCSDGRHSSLDRRTGHFARAAETGAKNHLLRGIERSHRNSAFRHEDQVLASAAVKLQNVLSPGEGSRELAPHGTALRAPDERIREVLIVVAGKPIEGCAGGMQIGWSGHASTSRRADRSEERRPSNLAAERGEIDVGGEGCRQDASAELRHAAACRRRQ